MAASDAAPSLLLCCLCRELLDEPVLLSCLHNCCKGCVSKYAAKRDGSILVRCSLCLQESDATTSMHNLFVAGLVKSEKLSREVPVCDFCIEEGRIETVVARCDECAKFMCQECVDGHRKFNKSHSVALTSGEAGHFVEAHAPSAHLCPLHDRRQIEMMCLRCELLTCLECAETCMTAVHEVQHIGSKSTQQFVSDTKTRLVDLHSLLDQPMAIGVQCMELKNALQDAKKEGTSQLLSNKTWIINAVENAHAEAQKALDENFDMLDSKVNELMTANEKLRERSLHAVQYSRALVHSGDVTCLLLQQKMLQSNLRALVDDQGKLHPPSKTSDLLKIQSNLPANVSKVLLAWIGTQAPIPDDIFSQSKESVPLATRQNGSSLTADGQQNLQSDSITMADDSGSLGTLSMLPVSSVIQAPVNCLDMALVSPDRVLLAAGEYGVREYDLNGVELSSWLPPAQGSLQARDSVKTVDFLDDGRIAAGLECSQCVVLLRRHPEASNAWVEEKRIDSLQMDPNRVATWADLLAVGGSLLILVSLSDGGRELLRKTLDYAIHSLAITSSAIYTSSFFSLEWSDGRKHSYVDGYSHAGDRLWRHPYYQCVCDICATPSGRVLYLSLHDSDAVRAIRVDNGRPLIDVLSSSSHGLKSPRRLSLLSGRGQGTVMAVLAADQKTVRVYPAASSE